MEIPMTPTAKKLLPDLVNDQNIVTYEEVWIRIDHNDDDSDNVGDYNASIKRRNDHKIGPGIDNEHRQIFCKKQVHPEVSQLKLKRARKTMVWNQEVNPFLGITNQKYQGNM